MPTIWSNCCRHALKTGNWASSAMMTSTKDLNRTNSRRSSNYRKLTCRRKRESRLPSSARKSWLCSTQSKKSDRAAKIASLMTSKRRLTNVPLRPTMRSNQPDLTANFLSLMRVKTKNKYCLKASISTRLWNRHWMKNCSDCTWMTRLQNCVNLGSLH